MAFGRLLLMLPLFGFVLYNLPCLLAEKLIKLHLKRSNDGWHIAEPEGRSFAESFLFGQPVNFHDQFASGKRSKRDISALGGQMAPQRAKNMTSVESGGIGATTTTTTRDKEFVRKAVNARVVIKIGHIGALVSVPSLHFKIANGIDRVPCQTVTGCWRSAGWH